MRGVYVAVIEKSPRCPARVGKRLRHSLREGVYVQLETIISRVLQYFKEICIDSRAGRVREIQVVSDACVLQEVIKTSSVIEPVRNGNI